MDLLAERGRRVSVDELSAIGGSQFPPGRFPDLPHAAHGRSRSRISRRKSSPQQPRACMRRARELPCSDGTRPQP